MGCSSIRGETAAPLQECRVNGELIPRSEIASEVANFPARTPTESWRLATQALILRAALRQRARRLGITPAPERDGDGRLETVEDATLRALVAHEVQPPRVSREEINAFYRANRRMNAQAFDLVEERIAAYLAERAQHRAVAAYLGKVMVEASVVEVVDDASPSADDARIRQFLEQADDEAWASLISTMNRAADPAAAARAAILQGSVKP